MGARTQGYAKPARREPPPSLRQRKEQAVREAIWEAAVELFSKKGFDQTTVEEVAQAAGISPRSFFRYFPSKGDVMAHGALRFGEQLVAAIEECPESFTPAGVIRAAAEKLLASALSEPWSGKIFAILRQSEAARGAEMARIPEVQRKVAAALSRRLPPGAGRGITAYLLAGIALQVTGSLVRWCFEHRETDPSRALDCAMEACALVFASPRKTRGVRSSR